MAAGRDWLEAFHFLDAANTGQTQWALKRLSPGVEYYFIIASNDARNGDSTVRRMVRTADAEWTTLLPVQPPFQTLTMDADDDGLIEVSQPGAAERHALGFWMADGSTSNPGPGYAHAFPNAVPDMGCPSEGCIGYELSANLDFDTNGSGRRRRGRCLLE